MITPKGRPSPPPPSQITFRLRPRCRRRRCIIDGIIGEPLATDIIGEQTFRIGKAGEIAQRISPSPGSAVSLVTSAHDVTRFKDRASARLSNQYFKLENMTPLIQTAAQFRAISGEIENLGGFASRGRETRTINTTCVIARQHMADPDVAARQLVEIANSVATIQDWRCHKMSFARQNCRPLRPHIRTIGLPDWICFALSSPI
jgi:hypothetical protein